MLAASITLLFVSMYGAPAAALGAKQTAQTTICDKLQTHAHAADERYTQLKSKVTDAWKNHDTTMQSIVQKEDRSIQDSRQKIDDQQKLNFAKLEDKAKTSSQKEAVTTYQQAIKNAQTVRRVAVDAARSDFRAGAAALVKSHRTDLTNQANGLSGAIDVAYATATTSCQGGVEPQAIRSTLIASLKSAHQQFVQDRKQDASVLNQTKVLAATRNQAIKAANASFTQTVKAATIQLRQAFNDNSL